ncbi:uncharacterized protein LOC123528537 [Mercenaria mercenaria]|uniref:uncharacterized protein LOC123528537 n=1 Tax=Mercenaria mercenaria TaxID=6596 RepID=UPI001E1DE849|nr:uncharacterized protein LOC123528537 [Mercenaria mercenaria]
MSEDGTNISSGSILEQNCRENWPRWTCLFANICGLCSTALWFIVLLPQVWKNFHRKSVKGLSVLWATANFTASLINLFFVFIYVSIPLYGQISSIYCPILEFTLLIQFWIYGRYKKVEKIVYATACFILWGIIIGVELIFTLENFVEYAAIFLWCIETFPQIILNMRLESTSGQSTGSVLIAMIGKTTDFISNNSLVMPLQYVIMVYFSSSVAYINGLQVAWYYGNDDFRQGEGHDQFWNPENSGHGEHNYNFHQSVESVEGGHNKWNNSSIKTGSTSETANKQSSYSALEQPNKQTAVVFTIRWLCILTLSVLLTGCVAGFAWNIDSYYGLFAPVSIACVIGAAKLYFSFCTTSKYTPQVIT